MTIETYRKHHKSLVIGLAFVLTLFFALLMTMVGYAAEGDAGSSVNPPSAASDGTGAATNSSDNQDNDTGGNAEDRTSTDNGASTGSGDTSTADTGNSPIGSGSSNGSDTDANDNAGTNSDDPAGTGNGGSDTNTGDDSNGDSNTSDGTGNEGGDDNGDLTEPIEVKNGLIKENGKYYYYKDDVRQKNQWIKIGKMWYRASADGSFYTSRFIKVGGTRYYVTATGAVKTGRYKVGKDYYYGTVTTEPAGKIKTGWFIAGGKGYVANKNGVLYKSRRMDKNGYRYYLSANGTMLTGTFKIGKNYYHALTSGKNLGRVGKGIFTDRGKKYAANKNGVLQRNKWITKDGKKYYAKKNGMVARSETLAIGGVPYKFRANGTMVVQKGWGSYKGKYYYKGKTGFPVKNQLVEHNNKTYYAGSKGLMISGWKKMSNGNYMYFNPKTYAWQQNIAGVKPPKKSAYSGPVWNTMKGVNSGPSGMETGYCLPMGNIVNYMRSYYGFDAKNYPYWVRSDGMKMLGPYVMVGGYFPLRPRGTVVETSKGLGLVVDTGFFHYGPTQLDLAFSW